MKNKNTTKRSLLASVMALVMCLAMLVGTTFAWFTDTASTSVNKIQSGSLKMKVSYKNAENPEFIGLTKDTNVFKSDTLWEPGHVEYAVLKVENVGTLALKYRLGINIANETGSTNVNGNPFKLSNYIKYAVVDGDLTETDDAPVARTAMKAAAGAGTSLTTPYTKDNGVLNEKNAADTVTLVVWMPEDVGNDANHAPDAEAPVINLGINVLATQNMHENDSFGPDYDETAAYPVIQNVATNEDFNAALALVNKASGAASNNVKITLHKDMNEATGIQTAANKQLDVDFNDKVVTIKEATGDKTPPTCGAQFRKGSTVTLKDGTYVNADNRSDGGYILIQNYSNLTLDNMYLDGTTGNVNYVVSSNCGNVLITGDTHIIAAADGAVALDVMHWENATYKADGSHVVIDENMTGTVNGKIDVYCYTADGAINRNVTDGGATLIIKGGTFVNSGLTLDEFKTFVPDGYHVEQPSSGTFKVVKD